MKMLLVGDINETLYSLHDYLSQEFQIQICSENGDNVRDMVRLFRPSIVVVLMSDINPNAEDVFKALTKGNGKVPVVVVADRKYSVQLEEMVSGQEQIRLMFRPVSNVDVCNACLSALNRSVDTEGKPQVKPGAGPQAVSRKKILVVDDNALVLRNIKSLLENQYDILLANSGEKALKVAKKEDLDLIFLDYEMPGMSGKEVFEALLGEEKTKNIPVVFLTAVADKEQIYAVLKNRPFGYILKPPANEEIKRVLREALDNK